MKKIVNKADKITKILGEKKTNLIRIKEGYERNENIENILNILALSKLLNKTNQNYIDEILKHSKNQIIDFSLLERGLEKVLRLKGFKQKNVSKYFSSVIKSLRKRELNKLKDVPEKDDFDTFEPEQPSIIPKKVFRDELYYLQVELLKLQEWLKNTGKTVIIVFEGRDSAGKGSTIKKFTENMNPRLYNVIALGVPSPEERKNWWDRYRNQIQKGKINLFDRSWYNRGLIEPVMGYGSPEEYEDFMENVADFESDLVKEGDYLFKLWFSIDKETQAERFRMRQQSPLKYWKYSPNDAKMQDLWDRFTEFKEKLFDKTSTLNHPWVVVDSNDKRVSGLNSIRYILQNIPYENKDESVLEKEYPEALTILKPEKD